MIKIKLESILNHRIIDIKYSLNHIEECFELNPKVELSTGGVIMLKLTYEDKTDKNSDIESH